MSSQHPEFDVEQAHLERTFQALDEKVSGMNPAEPRAATRAANHAVSTIQYNIQRRLATDEPYFGRIEFDAADLGHHGTDYYIGRSNFIHDAINIVSWAAPMAGLFYRGVPGTCEYEAPGGVVRGELRLKRQLEVKARRIEAIYDSFDTRERSSGRGLGVAAAPRPNTVLQHAIERPGAALRADITATIQSEQYALISAPAAGAMLIQGAAGSGKTSIALQRLAYLLYPENNAAQIQPSACVIFAPSAISVYSVRSVLPGLGVEGILQIPLLDWSLKEIGGQGLRVTDSALDALLDRHREPAELERITKGAHARNTAALGLVVEAYAYRLRAAPSLPSGPLLIEGLGPFKLAVKVTATQPNASSTDESPTAARARYQTGMITAAINAYADALKLQLGAIEADVAAMKQKADILRDSAALIGRAAGQKDIESAASASASPFVRNSNLAARLSIGVKDIDTLAELFEASSIQLQNRVNRVRDEWSRDEGRRGARREVAKQVRQAVAKWMNSWWGTVNTLTAIESLFDDRELLESVSEGLLSVEDIDAIVSGYHSPRGSVDVSDIPAAHLLHILLNANPPSFSHIMVDEGQDVSALHYQVLAKSSRNGSLTIVGDSNQNLFAFRSVASWDEAARALYPVPTKQFPAIRRSYRSSREVTEFANQILTTQNAPRLAEPFDRDGGAVQVVQASSPQAQLREVLRSVESFVAGGHEDIAVITRDPTSAVTIADELGQFIPRPVTIARGAEFEYNGGILVLPVQLARGLEFEAVVLTDVQMYGESSFDQTLLYVGATRALHALTVLAVGRLPGILTAATESVAAPHENAPSAAENTEPMAAAMTEDSTSRAQSDADPYDRNGQIAATFAERGYAVEDFRTKGGALWVYDPHRELGDAMRALAAQNIYFRFTGGRGGWYIK